MESQALPLSLRLNPSTAMLCLSLREQTEAGTLWSLLSTIGGLLSIQSQLCHMFVPLEAPRPFLQLAPLSPGLSSVRGRKSLSPSQVSGSELWIEGTIYQNSPHSESLQPSLFIFPIAFWEPTSCSSLSRFIIKGLGKKAWLLSSQTDPAWRGQDGTTSFSKLALSQSVESCFLLEQASSVISPFWKSHSTQPLDAPSSHPQPLPCS